MKKVLLASTVLAMTATVAAAEVTVGGSARMGVTYTEDNTAGPWGPVANELAFTSRIRISFTASGETDGGLSFGGSIRADNAGGGNAGTAGSVFVSGAFGKLSMGDVSGAAEFVVGDVDGVGLTGLGDHNENIYLSNNRRSAARYEYSTGGLTFAVSADNPGLDGTTVTYSFYGGATSFTGATQSTYSVGAKYSMDAYSFALGYESSEIGGVSVDHVIVGASATFSGVTVKATYGKADLGAGAKFDQTALSASYTMDALTVTGYYRQESINVFSPVDFTAAGIGASYDLGGGASVVGGIVSRKVDTAPSQTLADIGLNFTF